VTVKQPKPVVFLAAEIAMACKDVLPGRAAILADKLCRIGRSYYAASEQIANGGPEDRITALEGKLSKLEAQANALVEGLPVAFERSALHLAAVTVHKRRGGAFRERTTLL
jgi:hypothetical protein